MRGARPRVFCEGKPVEFVSKDDPAIDWTASDCTPDEYAKDPLGKLAALKFSGQRVGFWCRPPRREDVARYEVDSVSAPTQREDPETGEKVPFTDAELASLVEHNRTVTRGMFARCCVAVAHLSVGGGFTCSGYDKDGNPEFTEATSKELRLADADFEPDVDGQRRLKDDVLATLGKVTEEIGGYLYGYASLGPEVGNDSEQPSG